MIKEIKNELLNEKYYEIEHSSGLKVFVFPKAEYQSNFAIIGVPFGSADNRFITAQGKTVTLPDGTAHFLEHKLFESEEKDAFEKFAATGARANAYTSFDRTCYLFSCAENFYQNLTSLLEFVSDAYFTDKTVAKEQGIIGQEIKMYRDNPEWQATMGLLSMLYENSGAGVDIAGTVGSIVRITPDILYSVYENFYVPQNMVLCVCGNVSPEKVIAVCDSCMKPAETRVANSTPFADPQVPSTPKKVKEMPVSMPVFAFGYKETRTGLVPLKARMETVLLNQILIGTMSPLYDRLMCEGYIGEDFSSEYFTGRLYAAVLFTGSSEHAETIKAEFEKEVQRVRREGIDPQLFDCVIKDMYGTMIKGFNSVEDIASDMLDSYMGGFHYFEELELFKTITPADLQKLLQTKYNVKQSALSLVVPIQQKG